MACQVPQGERLLTGPQQALIQPLLAQLSVRFSPQELSRVRKAAGFAAIWHQGQLRRSGDAYITHPVAVAELAAEAGQDCATVCAALLHDVLEDTPCGPELLRVEFGEEVTSLVEAVTAFHAGQASPDDDRAMILTLLDRLHNMRTIEHLAVDKQVRKSREALQEYVPYAEQLGLRSVADELQELARHRLRVLADESGDEIRSPFLALRLGSLALPLSARIRYLEEWAAELRALAEPRGRRRFALQLLLGLPRLGLTLRILHWQRRYTTERERLRASWLARSGLTMLRWVLRSEVRSWIVLAPFMVWIVIQTAQGNPGNAVVTLMTVPPALAGGIAWLRSRLGITQRSNDETG